MRISVSQPKFQKAQAAGHGRQVTAERGVQSCSWTVLKPEGSGLALVPGVEPPGPQVLASSTQSIKSTRSKQDTSPGTAAP